MPITSGIKPGCPMSGSLFALAVDPFLRSILVSSLVDLIRLEAYADELANVLANALADLAEIMHFFDCSSLASGLVLNARKCVFVPVWAYEFDVVREQIAAVCPQLAACSVAGSARYLGVEVGPAAHEIQWSVVAQKILRGVADSVAEGESLGVRLRRFRFCAASLSKYRAQFVSIDGHIRHAWQKSLQRLTSAPWQSVPLAVLHALRELGFSSSAQDLQRLADSCRLRASSAVFDTCLAEISATEMDNRAMLIHLVRHWVESGILRSSDALRRRVAGDPGAEAALAGAMPEGALLRHPRAGLDLLGLAVVVRGRRTSRWAVEAEAEHLVAAALMGHAPQR